MAIVSGNNALIMPELGAYMSCIRAPYPCNESDNGGHFVGVRGRVFLFLAIKKECRLPASASYAKTRGCRFNYERTDAFAPISARARTIQFN